jgi:chromate transporter
MPAAEGLLYGIKPVVIAVVVQALWQLGRIAIKTRFLAAVGVAATLLGLQGANELVILFGGATFVAIGEWLMTRTRMRREQSHDDTGSDHLPMVLLPAITITPRSSVAATIAGGAAAATAVTQATLWPMFLVFLKIGSILFGSGYVLLAFLRADLAQRLGWLSESQLLTATAIGQMTPGPLFTTATFIGYMLLGLWGALVATVGIFLPAFFFVAVTAPFVPRLRRSVVAGRFLDGLNVASLALMLTVTWALSKVAIIDVPTAALAAASAFLLIKFRTNSAWLVLGGALIGLVIAR